MKSKTAQALGAVAAALLFVATPPARAEAGPSLTELQDRADFELEEELKELGPGFLTELQEANRVYRAHDWEKAFALYQELQTQIPHFLPLSRRLCEVQLRRGLREQALVQCRQAARDGSPMNLQALASALVTPPARTTDIEEARALASKALSLWPENEWIQTTACEVAVRDKAQKDRPQCLSQIGGKIPAEYEASLFALYSQRQLDTAALSPAMLKSIGRDLDYAVRIDSKNVLAYSEQCRLALKQTDNALLSTCSLKLRQLAPEQAMTHIYSAAHFAGAGEFDLADAALERAEELGGGKEALQAMRERIAKKRPFYDRYKKPFYAVYLGWILATALMRLLGAALSDLALWASKKCRFRPDGRPFGMNRFLKRAYWLILSTCCAYYYISIPAFLLPFFWVLLILCWQLFSSDKVPAWSIYAVLVFCAGAIALILKNLFVRPKQEDPGLLLDLNSHPKLRGVLTEVAKRTGTAPVERVYLHPGSSLGVFERKEVLSQYPGPKERYLVMGAGLFHGLTLVQFKALLAHEFAHYSNQDTSSDGQLALGARRSLDAIAMQMIRSGSAKMYNPFWIFLNRYYRMFLRISQGAARLQEVLADRWAICCYGLEPFTEALQHSIRRKIYCAHQAKEAFIEIARDRTELTNLYDYIPVGGFDTEQMQKEYLQSFDYEPSLYDSHPSPRQRLELAQECEKRRPVGIEKPERDEQQEAWVVFCSKAWAEQAMTRFFQMEVLLSLKDRR